MRDGRGHLDWIPEITSTGQSPYTERALRDFMILITNPLWQLLGGPCVRCGSYYLKKAKRQKIYCSRNCGSGATAITRQQDHANKIRFAQIAIDEWSKAKRRLDWKRWVSIRTGYTDRWITRAANKGSLRPPDES